MSSLFAVAFVLAALGSVIGLLGALFWRGRRRRLLGIGAMMLLGAIGSGVAFTQVIEDEALAAGFNGYVDRGYAEDAGYTDPRAWSEVRGKFEADRASALKAQVAAAAAAKAQSENANAAVAAAPSEKDLACRNDLVCWGEKQLVWAGFKCPPEIERLATYGAEWTDSWMELKFERYGWLDKERGTLTMVGDALEFENGFGAKSNMIYECDIDPIAEAVIEVRAYPGRL